MIALTLLRLAYFEINASASTKVLYYIILSGRKLNLKKAKNIE